MYITIILLLFLLFKMYNAFKFNKNNFGFKKSIKYQEYVLNKTKETNLVCPDLFLKSLVTSGSVIEFIIYGYIFILIFKQSEICII